MHRQQSALLYKAWALAKNIVAAIPWVLRRRPSICIAVMLYELYRR